ncbi:hypothetical protein EX30DRAFT_389180 [Ascodesmis nigricans]|uniref:Uncharacterized protein n=1 Tax=Ascodesmis nigricans TaxID=341454 RepID=A0A4S2MIY4_9PEZI|nr:hypothetical protein EX30DRAFT_389180 [Ascodesmis nigricans]
MSSSSSDITSSTSSITSHSITTPPRFFNKSSYSAHGALAISTRSGNTLEAFSSFTPVSSTHGLGYSIAPARTPSRMLSRPHRGVLGFEDVERENRVVGRVLGRDKGFVDAAHEYIVGFRGVRPCGTKSSTAILLEVGSAQGLAVDERRRGEVDGEYQERISSPGGRLRRDSWCGRAAAGEVSAMTREESVLGLAMSCAPPGEPGIPVVVAEVVLVYVAD